MKREWQEEDISKVLKKMGGTAPPPQAYEHVWHRIEERVAKRHRRFLDSVVWRPWGHPIRWVAAAACLIVALNGFWLHEESVDQNELGAYLISVSNTAESVTADPDLVRVSVLLSEPSYSMPDMTVENHVDPLATDEIFL